MSSRRATRRDGALNVGANIAVGPYAGMEKREAWMREAAKLYVEAEEIEGVPNPYAMRPGLVFMTRDLLKAAWDNALGFAKPTSTPTSSRESHKSDYWVTRLTEEERLITVGRGNYMLSEELIARYGLTDLNATFLDRRDKADLAKYGTDRKGQWAAIQESLYAYDLFDLQYIDRYAKGFGMETHGGGLTTQKLDQWTRSGFCYRVARGMYRVAKWDFADDAPVKQIEFHNWMHEFIRHQSSVQYRNPDATFSAGSVSAIFMDKHYDVYCETRKYLRNDRHYISHRLTQNSLKPGETDDETLFVHLSRNRFQINPMVIHRWFRYDLFNDSDALARRLIEYVVRHTGAIESCWFIEQDIGFILPGYGGSAQKIIRKLLDWKYIEIDGDYNSAFWSKATVMRPANYQPTPVYVPSPRAFEAFNRPYDNFEMKEEPGTGRLLRRWVEWEDDPEFKKSIEHIEHGFAEAARLKKEVADDAA